MPYAANDKISKSSIAGGISIADTQYKEALATLSQGGHVFIHEGQMILTFKPEQQAGHKAPVWQNGAWYHEPLPEPEPEVEEETND
jgi:hypothetical protein